ncbi:MAG: HRDC domain-containing protein [Elusimicrobiota bacterium]|nr:HRDC domain-containing protein [Elusimicrobiota bacterium]
MPYTLIDNQASFEELIGTLHSKKYISIDTESNSLFAYRGSLCLLQLAAENIRVIVDTLKVDITSFEILLVDKNIEKIFHSAEADIKTLKLAFKTNIHNIFDVMLAAKYMGIRKCGLDGMVKEYFDVKLNKKFQKANWGARPLSEKMLGYAINDVRYLKKLRDIFYLKLKKNDLLDEITEEFVKLTKMEPKEPKFDRNGYLAYGLSRKLSMLSLAVLKELYCAREKTAAKLNVPPFKVISEDLMLRLSRGPEHALMSLVEYKGITKYVYNMHGEWIKEAIKRGLKEKTVTIPKKVVLSQEKMQHYHNVKDRIKKLKRWRIETAKKRNMLSEVIIEGETLEKIAYRNPKTQDDLLKVEGFLPIKVNLYGKEIINVLSAEEKLF